MVPEMNGGLAPVLSSRGGLSLFLLIKLTEVFVSGEEEDEEEERGEEWR